MEFPSESYQPPFADNAVTEYRSHFSAAYTQMTEDQQAPAVRSRVYPQSPEYDERLFPAGQDTVPPIADSSSFFDFLISHSPPDEASDVTLPSDYYQMLDHTIPYYAMQPQPFSPRVDTEESLPLDYATQPSPPPKQ
jgi:hypothetical protein